jgi:Protein of unknown function (DUF3311).
MTITPVRKRVLFVVGLLALALTWPGYALFARARPFIFGFPTSFAWLIACVLAGFAALVVLYQHDNKRKQAKP